MDRELPMAFAENLARNESALAKFEAMSDTEKDAVLAQLKNVNSRKEMKNLINQLGSDTAPTKSATDNQWVSTGISKPDNRSERRDGPGGE